MEIEVKGHSGCQIEIVREDKDLFLFKSSHDKKYLPRLIKQAEKQSRAYKDEYQHIRIPQIFAVNHDAHYASIKMEYVYSRNFIEYFESAGFEQIDYFIKALILFVEKEIKNSPLQSVSTYVTMEKYLDVDNKIQTNPFLRNDNEIQELMNLAKERFLEFSKLSSIAIPIGICHGDLTFSNILFNGNNYYLIDFLDSFIESPLMDIVKIRQDSYHLWSQLMYVKSYDKLRLMIICEKIDKEIHKYFSKYEWYSKYYDIYQLLNLLRILQYAKEKKVIEFLKVELSKLLNLTDQDTTPQTEEFSKKENKSRFSLIIPVAADNNSHPEYLPYVFSLDSSGIMLCIRSIQGLNLEAFDDIFFTILRKHAEKFFLDELFNLQFKRLGITNAHLIILNEPTQSQTETVYRSIQMENIQGGIFIKDADGFFKGDVRKENGIALYPLEQMSIVNPRNKSYVAVDDMYYITNVIEKKIIGHYFNAGGSCFEDANDFCRFYLKLSRVHSKVLISHIIYQMLLSKYSFRPIEVDDFIDWGNKELFNYYNNHK